MQKRNWMSCMWLFVFAFIIMAGGCGGGGDSGSKDGLPETGDEPVNPVVPVDPGPITGNWIDVAETSWYNQDKTNFSVRTPRELAGVAKLAKEGNGFSGKTITLANDIDLAGGLWTPIENFGGAFEGKSKQIAGIKIMNEGVHGVDFFKTIVTGSKVSNVNLVNVDVTGGSNVGGLAGGNIGISSKIT